MSSRPNRPGKRWASAALVIGSVGAVLASPLALGTAAAATPQTVSSVTITSPAPTVASNSATAATATVSGTYTASADNGGDPGVIDYTVTNGGDQSAANAGTLCTSVRTSAAGGTFSCSVANTSKAPASDLVQVFSDTDASGGFNAGDAAGANSTTTVTFSGPPTTVHFTTSPTTSSTGTCAVYTASTTGGTGGTGAQPLTLTVTDTTTAASPASSISLYNAGCTSVVSSGGNATVAGGTSTYTTTVTTAADGTVSFGIASSAAGTGSVELSVGPANSVISDTAAVTWGVGGENSITTVTPSPTSTTQLTNTTASFTVTASNGSGPVQGVAIMEETDPAASPANADTIAPTSCGTTNSSGQATCTVHNGGTAGADSLIFWVNHTSGACGTGGLTTGPDPACEAEGHATATFGATPAVDPGHSSLTCIQQLAGADKGAAKTNCTVPTTQTSVTFTATVEDVNGNPIANAPVTFTASAAKIGGTTLSGSGLPSGTATTGTNGTATFVVNDPTPAAGDNVALSAKVGAISIGSDTVTWATPVASSLAVTPALQTVTVGGTVTVKATVNDQFGTPVTGTSTATYFVTGRNNAKTGSAAADGTITYIDAGTSPSVKTDAIQVTSGAFTGTANVVYVTGAITASTVTVDTSGLGVSDGTCAATGNVAATGVAFQHNTEVCAVVKNATGEVLAGKTVTFTVSNGQVAAHSGLTTTSGTTYTATTDAAGVAFADVTSTKSGAQTVTATSDTATGSGTVTYLGPTAAQAYKIVVTPTPTTITPGGSQKFVATVTDKFGNPVPGVLVVYTQSGTGTVGSGSGGTVPTGVDGTASVTVSTTATDTGSGSVTFNIGTAATVPANQCATTGGVCSAVASYTVATTGAAFLTLTAEAGAKVGTHETIHAVATNADGSPAAHVIVRFIVQGANSATGSLTTGAAGHAGWSYLASHHGTDTISAWVDNNDNQLPDSNEPGARVTAHIKGIERPTISVVSHAKTAKHGTVAIHVVSRPLAKGATVHYFVKRNGSWVKIGTNRTGHLGKTGMTFTEVKGRHLVFRAKVMTTPVTTTGTSSPKSVTVR